MEACSSWFLPRLIGHSKALHLTMTGSVYPAESPLFGDLFTELADSPEGTLKRALELADDIAKNTSTVSTKMMRDLMYRGPDSAEAAHLLDSKVIYSVSPPIPQHSYQNGWRLCCLELRCRCSVKLLSECETDTDTLLC